DPLKSLGELPREGTVSTRLFIRVGTLGFRSFQGLVCLMQLSTRSRDYIVDAVKLRGDIGKLLPIFTDPSIVKVLHGSDSDILWLQRDLSLYVVNMFDTGQVTTAVQYCVFIRARI
ncbi:unnamed protein product, partial [Sphacelaria rigidula]